MKVFQLERVSCHNISPSCPRRRIRVKNLTELSLELDGLALGSVNFTHRYWHALLRGSCPGWFFTACVCSEHQIILHDQSVKQIFSGYFKRGFYIILFSVEWFLCCLWCSTPDVGHFKATLCNFSTLKWFSKPTNFCNSLAWTSAVDKVCPAGLL